MWLAYLSCNGSSKLVVSRLHPLSFFVDFVGSFEDQSRYFVYLLFSDTVRRRLHNYYLQEELLMPYYTTELKSTPNKQMEDIFIFVGVCVSWLYSCIHSLLSNNTHCTVYYCMCPGSLALTVITACCSDPEWKLFPGTVCTLLSRNGLDI